MEAFVLHLIEKISVALGAEVMSLLVKEVSRVAQIPDAMNRIQREYVVMKALLKHSDMQREDNDVLQVWLKLIQETEFGIEVLIDEYSCLTGEHYRSGLSRSAQHAQAWLGVADQIKKIESELQHISEMRTRYGIKTDRHLNHAITRDFHQADSSYSIAEDELVGIRKERKQLHDWLIDEKLALRLEPKEACDLFFRKVFRDDEDKKCLEALKPLAEKIVGKCQDLPLAIVAIGGLLSLMEINKEEWRKVHNHLNSKLTDNPDSNVRHILNLSFIYLPDYLKNCFLYLSIFPENYVIKKKRLIKLWVAEGFIEEKGAKTMEEVAEEYFNELIHRCMLQVVKRNFRGIVKSCRMHDLVREFNVLTAKEKRFSTAYDGTKVEGLDGKFRRLSLNSKSHDMQLPPSLKYLRSFFIFDTTIPASLLTSVIKKFRLLRVLYLQEALIEEVPDEVFNLFNLHYLSLRKTKVKVLPDSIKNLHNLQTLDLKQTNIEKLPCGITELKKLRNLVIERIYNPTAKNPYSICGAPAPEGMWDSKGLQTLHYVEASWRFIRQISNLTQLRTLGITKVKSMDCAKLCASLTKMRFLAKLTVIAYDEDELLELEALDPPPRALEKLYLRGKLARGLEIPLFNTLGSTISILNLECSGLIEDPLPSLSQMSNLVHLCLEKTYTGRLLRFSAGWFPKLRTLYLGHMKNLQTLEIQDGSLQSLVSLVLGNLEGMKGCPPGIQFLKKLETLGIMEMPTEFIVDLRGSSRNCVKHIPNITHFYEKGGKWFKDPTWKHLLC